MRRLLRSAAILASIVGLLAGCGDDDDDAGSRDTLETQETAAALDTTTAPLTVATTAPTAGAGTATTAATTPAGGGQTYTVASGDALSTIAARFQTSVKAIQDANGIEDPNKIFVGQKLQIPPPTTPPATTATTLAGAGTVTSTASPTTAAVTPPPAVTATTVPGTPGD